jgi:catechol-2,3-dioxygenase
MKPTKIGHVVLKVRDLARAEAFYTEALGFEVVTRLDQPRAVFLSLGEQHHDLALFEVSAAAADPEDDQVGLHHVALQVQSEEMLKEGYSELKRRGIHCLRAVDHGTTHSIYFCDPAGNRLELYCDIGTDGLARARSRTARTLDDFASLDLDGESAHASETP